MTLPGLDHQLGDDIDALRDAVRAFVQRELAPRAAQIDQDKLFPPTCGASLATSACTA